MNKIRFVRAVLATLFLAFNTTPSSGAPRAADPSIPLYGLLEIEAFNSAAYENPFADVELNGVFTSPTGRKIRFFGFFDGSAKDGRNGGVWKQRFMPDEVGAWTYALTFSDGQPGTRGGFQCVAEGAKPGPWRQDPDAPRWFRTARGDHFLPAALFANCVYSPIDWQDAVQWCRAKGFNTLITRTFNHYVWGDGWKNVTCFGTANAAKREVNYDHMNLEMWREWDQMIQHAGENGIYIGSFEGPCGKYGGQWRGKYPPSQLVMNPGIRDRFDTPRNLKVIRYLVARQGAFWNLAYWSLGNTEVYAYAVADEREFLEYGEYFASITPWERMITGQDAEQWHGENRRWMSKLNIPNSRKLNTVQTAVSNPNRPSWGKSNINDTAFQNAGPNNELALDSYGGFPVLTTEGLWEGQGRATKPLRIIWGFFAAGAHTMWADWNFEQPDQYDFGSIGRGWAPPVKPLDEHQFRIDQLGVNCVGDEQLKIATDAMNELRYWKMTPHNEIVAGSTEAYCLAEPGAQYMVYAPNGGTVKLALSDALGAFNVKWLDPRTGRRLDRPGIRGGSVCRLDAPDAEDWVLLVTEQLPGEKEPGFVSLFDGKTFDQWLNPTSRWSIEGGRMVFSGDATSGGLKREDHKLMTVNKYDDFVLRFEFKIGKRANSGVAVRAPLQGNAAFVAMEIQIIDQLNWNGLKTWQAHGSIYGVVAAETGHLKQPGEWNTEEIICQGSHVKVTLNGAVIVNVDVIDLGDKTLDGKKHPGLKRTEGHIGFLPHTKSSEYRNVRIKKL